MGKGRFGSASHGSSQSRRAKADACYSFEVYADRFAMILESRTRAAFKKAPEGFVAGTSWFYFAFEAAFRTSQQRLFGYTIWGRPSGDDIRDLVSLLDVELERPPHDALVDLGQLEAVEAEAFQALASYTVRNEAALARIVQQAVLVRPNGVPGAVVAGILRCLLETLPRLLLALDRDRARAPRMH